MVIRGRIFKDRAFYVVDVPGLGGPITQGHGKTDALRMAAAWVRDTLDRQDMGVRAIADAKGNGFALHSSDPALVALLLRCRRQAAGMTVRQAAQAIGAKGPAAWHRYETDERAPGLEQLDRILAAVGGELALA